LIQHLDNAFWWILIQHCPCTLLKDDNYEALAGGIPNHLEFPIRDIQIVQCPGCGRRAPQELALVCFG